MFNKLNIQLNTYKAWENLGGRKKYDFVVVINGKEHFFPWKDFENNINVPYDLDFLINGVLK